ncbi:MAG: pyridoxal-phosphate dependent enzyme [bacterium]
MTAIPTASKAPLLFEALPGLERRFPWISLVEGPTPVQLLERLSARVGGEIWVKRDDQTSPVYGGNKPRKLEFLLAHALSAGAHTLVTAGGLGTNHGLATAIFGGKLGFHVVLGLFDQPVTEHVRRSLLLYHSFGAEMMHLGSKLRGMLQLGILERIRRPQACFIPLGGSSPVGCLGFVNAGLELARQIERGHLPRPASIFVAVGSCGTMAGLVLGLKLAGVPVPVVGVQVAPRIVVNPRAVLRLARRTQRLLDGGADNAAGGSLCLRDFPVETHHYGSGYGHPTAAGRSAASLLAQTEGIPLEPTYTAKTFAAVLARAGQKRGSGPVLFWNTFNSVDLSSKAQLVDPFSLPKAFHRFFACRPHE